MLPRGQKISRAAFGEVLNSKKSAASPFFSLRFYQTEKITPSRFSFVVSKKVAGSAVERNTLKRRGYSFLQKNKKHITPAFVIAFFLKKGAEKLSAARFGEEVVSLLLKIGVWK